MAKKKMAMVQPPPSKPKPKPPKPADLIAVLHLLRNDRPYTLLDTLADSWIVHFSGDLKPSAITQIDGKWVILQSK